MKDVRDIIATIVITFILAVALFMAICCDHDGEKSEAYKSIRAELVTAAFFEEVSIDNIE